MSKVNFKAGDKVILARGFVNPMGVIFTLEKLLNLCPTFKDPQEIIEVDYSPSLLTLYKQEDMPCLYFMVNNEELGMASTSFDLYQESSTQKLCSCSIVDLMIRGCKCGGK